MFGLLNLRTLKKKILFKYLFEIDDLRNYWKTVHSTNEIIRNSIYEIVFKRFSIYEIILE